MSIQGAPDDLTVIPVTRPGGCTQPALVTEPIDEISALGLALVFKALGDPVRLRLVSLIGAREGIGEHPADGDRRVGEAGR